MCRCSAGVLVYEHCDFEGRAMRIPLGRYNFDDLMVGAAGLCRVRLRDWEAEGSAFLRARLQRNMCMVCLQSCGTLLPRPCHNLHAFCVPATDGIWLMYALCRACGGCAGPPKLQER